MRLNSLLPNIKFHIATIDISVFSVFNHQWLLLYIAPNIPVRRQAGNNPFIHYSINPIIQFFNFPVLLFQDIFKIIYVIPVVFQEFFHNFFQDHIDTFIDIFDKFQIPGELPDHV